MSFVFRGNRAELDLENGFPGFVHERRAMVRFSSVPKHLMFVSGLMIPIDFSFLFIILLFSEFTRLGQLILTRLYSSSQLWLVLGVFLMATILRMYATCQQLQAQVQAHAAITSGLLGHTELRLHMPPSIALATRGRLQGLRLQLALLDREFDDLDYETLRVLDSDVVPTTSMSEEEISALPVHNYKVSASQSSVLAVSGQQASSFIQAEPKKETCCEVGNVKVKEDELTCSVCLEQVDIGEVIRTLPCLHQFHVICIDPWLRQQGTCPVCKYRAGSSWPENGQSVDTAYMV
ncbi:E3 ubiquitin-protein ligase SDIR1 [Linum grandiflorum]